MLASKRHHLVCMQQAFQLGAVLLCLLAGHQVATAEVQILTRKEWKAQSAKENEDINARVEKELEPRKSAVYLTVHHNQEPVRTMPLAEQLRKHQELMFHYTIDGKKKGVKTTTHVILRDTPYHYFVDATGQVAEGRELRFAAYSNTKYVTPISQHITVVLEGDFDDIQPTDNQMKSLVNLLADLAKKHNIELRNIGYHQGVVEKEVRRDGSISYGTNCPGKNLIDRFDQVRRELSKRGIK